MPITLDPKLEARLVSQATGDVDMDAVEELFTELSSEDAQKQVRRSSMLPAMFSIQGTPFSLYDYPQMRPLYDACETPTILYCNGRQTSKSQNLARSEVYDMAQYEHFHVMYVAPLQEQTRYYSTTVLREALEESAVAQILRNRNLAGNSNDKAILANNVFNKMFANGSQIRLSYAHTSSDRARGAYADRIDFDEVQDHRVDNLGIITQSLTQSEYGLTRYTGTAKTTDNTIEYLRLRSSQTEWGMKCRACNHWNIPTVEGGVLKMIRAHGPSCCKCGTRLDVRGGQFIHGFPDRASENLGIHVPQMVVPAITENPVKWNRFLQKVLNQPVEQTLQELLGLACSQGSRLITLEDIKRCCNLGSMIGLRKNLKQYAYIIGGIDWGVSEITSYTVHTIIGLTQHGEIHVLWVKRYAGFNPDEVLQDITKAHVAYGCHFVGADFGMGYDKNIMLQTRFGLPVVMIQYTRQKLLLTYNEINGYARYMADRTTSLENMFYGIRYDRLRFPDFGEMELYVNDLLSPFLDVNTVNGIESKRFLRDPTRPDDFAHALNFALLTLIRVTGASVADIMPDHGMGADQPISGDLDELTRDNVNPYEGLDQL